ncbi:MAG: DUF1800 family protein [Candidatus Thiodiazotropha sp. (ex Monitilora ramsayi)]|nr:DUF1800 family protein [Candidatus Thiodiazotropha sp. (ex Monitilora ramsayi)]
MTKEISINQTIISAVVFVFTISGCGGGGGDSSNPTTVTNLSGTATKGIVKNALVEARRIENYQRTDTVIASSVTDDSGGYSLDLANIPAGVIEVTVRGRTDAISTMVCDAPSGCGNYAAYIGTGPFTISDIPQADLNANGQVDFGESHPIDDAFQMKSLTTVNTPGSAVTAHITPMTHLVAEIAYAESRVTATDLSAITEDIQTLFGFSSDPTLIQTVDLTDAQSSAAILNTLTQEQINATLQVTALFASIAEQSGLNGITLTDALDSFSSATRNTLIGNAVSQTETLFTPGNLSNLQDDVLAAADSGDLTSYINFAPVADADNGTTDEGGSTIVYLLDGDSDADQDSLSVTNLTAPNHGTVQINNDGSATYTHDGSETVEDSFTYTASDGVSESAVTPVTIAITPLNDAPVADNDTGTVSEGGSVTIHVFNGDSDAEGDALTVTNLTSPSHGALQLNNDGSVIYTHNGSNTVSDSFNYTASDGALESSIATVSITILPVNFTPIAINDNTSIAEGGNTIIPVLANDSDADGDSLSVTNLTSPSHGIVSLNPNGTVNYSHDGSETVLDSFSYTAFDGINSSTSATVNITVLPLNDPPVANNDSGTVNEGSSVAIAVLNGDSDAEGDALTVTNLTSPSHGSLQLNGDGSITYTHNGSNTTSDSFTYTAYDGISSSAVATVNVTIVPQNDAPEAISDNAAVSEGSSIAITPLTNDSDADQDSLSVTNLTSPNHGTVQLSNDGIVTYTHDGSETLTDSFTYTASDGVSESAVTTVTIAITPLNDAPVADNDSATVSEGGNVTIAVLNGDSDAEGDALSVTNLTSPTQGTVQLNSDGSVTYIHNGSNTVSDSFTYTASDGSSESAIATVSITIVSTNDIPVAVSDSATVNEEGNTTIAVLNNDSDADGDSLSVTNLTSAGHGIVSLNPNGTVNYTHNGSETFSDSFTYTAYDGINTSAIATVNITVLPQNDAPVANNDSAAVSEGDSITITPLIDDTDAENDTLSLTNLTAPDNGTVLLNGDGSVTYTHDGSETLSDSFTYTANDGSLDSNIATVSIAITPQNDPPVFVVSGADADLPIDTTYTLTVTAADPDGDPLTYSATGLPDWLTFNPGTRTLSGTPTWGDLEKSFTVTLSVTDSVVTVDNQFTLSVQEPSIITDRMAHRLLLQATFGPIQSDIQQLQSQGLVSWLDNQLNMPSAYDNSGDDWKTHLERCIEIALAAEPATNWYGTPAFNEATADGNSDDYQMAAWWDNALGNPDISLSVGSDQLRQRMAYALSQLLVTSHTAFPLNRRGEALAYYYDLLARHALGNYRTLLGEISRSPTMGVYLSHQGNRKANAAAGTRPDENFAREIMQLFTIGLYELNLDGSPNRDANHLTYPDASSGLVPTYTQTDIEELAKVMTGWDLVDNNRYGRLANRDGDYTRQMEFTPGEHEDEIEEGGDGNVTILGSTIALNSGSDGSGMDPVIDLLFAHPNTAPFVSKHLIQRFVSSNPSPSYIARIAAVFNDNGIGEKGDLKAVIRAILLDPEARGDNAQSDPNFGKVKEPLLALTHFLRAVNTSPLNGWSSQGGIAMSNLYWLPRPESFLGQAPMRSPSVFNFYSPDFIPSDSYFSTNALVGPEYQIQTDQMLVDYSNKLNALVQTYERTKIEITDGSDPATFAATKTHTNQNLILTDFTPLMEMFEQAMEGDSNGDFAQIQSTVTDAQGDTPKANGIDALLDYLDLVLLGNRMTPEFRAGLKHYLLVSSGTNVNNNATEARLVIRDAFRMTATSSQFMIQK